MAAVVTIEWRNEQRQPSIEIFIETSMRSALFVCLFITDNMATIMRLVESPKKFPEN